MSLPYTPEETNQTLLSPSAFVGATASDVRRTIVRAKASRLGGGGSFWSRLIRKRLESLRVGQLTLVDDSGAHHFGRAATSGLAGLITVRDRRFYRTIVLGGSLGAAEAYIRGYWDSPDLTTAMVVLSRNWEYLAEIDTGVTRLLTPLRTASHWLRQNTRTGSKRNISAHYDLSNEFFSLMLDTTMTYSSGMFPTPTSTLEEASIAKYDRICRKLQLKPQDRVLEIGSGWGGFAEHAARHYGCHVTTITISAEQHDYAAARLRNAGLSDRVTLLKKDYRDLSGEYDKLVSIEMVEAVGEKFLPGYFRKCSELLRADGLMLLQAITIPDCRYDDYRNSVDFIQRYIFPGGFLPSMGAIAGWLERATDLRFAHTEEFGEHYARTLAHWRSRFWRNIDAIKSLGFPDRFIRTWHYYLCYCEAGFRDQQIDVTHLLLAKPAYDHSGLGRACE